MISTTSTVPLTEGVRLDTNADVKRVVGYQTGG
jgi:hypothetical protein